MSNSIDDALTAKVIAVVGLSKDPSKPSYEVASYLRDSGYKIVPVNPNADFILGEKCFKSLLDMPDDIKRGVDVVDIFRPSDEVLTVVKEAAEIHVHYLRPSVVWMQLGIVNETAAQVARDSGMEVVMNRCMKIEHEKTKVNKIP